MTDNLKQIIWYKVKKKRWLLNWSDVEGNTKHLVHLQGSVNFALLYACSIHLLLRSILVGLMT